MLDLRTHNEARILEYIRRHPGATQTAIAEGVGLTRAAVSKLIGAGDGGTRGPRRSKSDPGLRFALDWTSGRPANYYLKAHLGAVVSIDMGMNHIRVRLADLAGNELEPRFPDADHPVGDDPRMALRVAADLTREALESTVLHERPRGGEPTGEPIALTREMVAGMAIGVPFPVSRDGQVVGPGAWRYVQMPSAFWDRLREWETEWVVTQSDSNLGAWAEFEATLEAPFGIPDLSLESLSVLYVKWSSDISGGIVTGGRQHIGHGGLGAQFAHVVVPGEDDPATDAPRCQQCGRHCVAVRSSVNAIIEQGLGVNRKKFGPNAQARAALLTERAERDPAVRSALDDAARRLGHALGLALNILNPQLLIVGGAFEGRGLELIEPALQQGLEETTHPAILAPLIVRSGRRTGEAAVVGGLLRALHEFGVEHVLSKRPDRS